MELVNVKVVKGMKQTVKLFHYEKIIIIMVVDTSSDCGQKLAMIPIIVTPSIMTPC